MNYAVIIAGGIGKRLWPLSRENKPKQVLRILDDNQTLLGRCYHRLLSVFDPRNILILTKAGFSEMVCENLPEVPFNNVIEEPAVRDTAPAIALAASIISKSDQNATMAVIPADHLIKGEENFRQALKDGISFVNSNPETLMTFGVKPKGPDTQYGYIECSKAGKPEPKCKNRIFTVASFKEKPPKATARKYLEAGNFFYNSGMFIWKAETILEKLNQFMPGAWEPLQQIRNYWDSPAQEKTFEDNFPKLPKISIDYAVMEKSSDVYTIKLDCEWLDVGSFAAFADIVSSDENDNIVIAQQNQLLDCRDSILVTEQKDHLLAGIGLEGMIVVQTPDATLICSKDQAHRIKHLLEHIEKKSGKKFL